MTITSERTLERPRYAIDAIKRVPLGNDGDLLPWADPYIAELYSTNRAEEALDAAAQRRGGKYRLDHGQRLSIRNEAPPPLGETPFRYSASTRRDQRQERPVCSPKPLPK